MTSFQVAWPSCEVLSGDCRRGSAFAGSSRREENKSKSGSCGSSSRLSDTARFHQSCGWSFHGCLTLGALARDLRHGWLRPAQARHHKQQRQGLVPILAINATRQPACPSTARAPNPLPVFVTSSPLPRLSSPINFTSGCLGWKGAHPPPSYSFRPPSSSTLLRLGHVFRSPVLSHKFMHFR